MEKKMELKNMVTFGHLLAIMSILVIPLLIWGIKIERHLENSKIRDNAIIMLERELDKLHNNGDEYQKKTNNDYLNILEKLHSIDLKVSKNSQ